MPSHAPGGGLKPDRKNYHVANYLVRYIREAELPLENGTTFVLLASQYSDLWKREKNVERGHLIGLYFCSSCPIDCHKTGRLYAYTMGDGKSRLTLDGR